ncbi:hypothetical protein [Flavisolibacter tropicus]|uniref:Anti-sigma factor n=1 Tax=Flavisolibacter tropicus TaxID=1492898 RepID=A0A172TSU0_9BACT|nr:hypothetical protein [Flavisolibacter tropicus]ANE50066.1 hypothetical protein SY85_05700 [Flavisolibacter tropicus]
MKERLEEFVNTNRQAFDDEPVPAFIWDEMSQQLDQKRKPARIIRLSRFNVWAAAVAMIIAGIVIFLIAENNQLKSDLTASQQRLKQHQLELNTTTNYDQELGQFMQIVASKQNQLSGIRKEYPSLYQSFTADINDLNEEYKKLKEELTSVPEQDQILDAMIQNLKLQAELLNEQLLIIQQLKSSKKNKNEKATSVI